MSDKIRVEYESLLKRYNDTHRLTAPQWDRLDYLQRTLDPDAFNKRQEDGARRVALRYAAKLSVDDLKALIAEKEAST